MTTLPLYTRLIHSDWSTSPRKRWTATAVREKTGWRVGAPSRVGDTELFLSYLRDDAIDEMRAAGTAASGDRGEVAG
jgi:hypothetical protein